MYKIALIPVIICSGATLAWNAIPQSPTATAGAKLTNVNPTGIQQEKEQEKDKPEKKRIVIPADDDKSSERQDFMRIKMQASQSILEGLTVKDFELVNKGIKQIKEMTESEKWVTIDNKFYKDLVKDFSMATERLEAAAKTKNIDATAMRYFQLTTNCIDCHKHIREAAYEL